MTGAGHATWLEVDLAAVEHNLREVRRLAGPRRVIAAIKADAYGFGAVGIASALERFGVDGLWTGNIDEAIAVRAAGVSAPIIMFGGYLPEHIDELVRHDLVPTVYDRAGLAAASAVAERRGRPVPVFVKVDGGLRRLGVPVSAAGDLVRAVTADGRLVLDGLYTHLPFGDGDGQVWAAQRSALFHQLLGELDTAGIRPATTQLWGSSGLLAGLPDETNTVCVGHLLYGLSPLAGNAAGARFRPAAAALRARIVHVGRHADGRESSPYVLGGANRTGVLALGTGEGMRGISHGRRMDVLVRGRPARVLGVSLEHTVVSLECVDGAGVGEEVVLLGRAGEHEVTLAAWAAWFGCSELEVAVSLFGRLPKRYGSRSS